MIFYDVRLFKMFCNYHYYFNDLKTNENRKKSIKNIKNRKKKRKNTLLKNNKIH